MLPKGWHYKTLDEVSKVIDCKHRTPKYVDNGVPLVSPGTIKWGAIDLESPKKRVTNEEFESLMDHCTVDFGDLVLSRNQSVGIASFVDSDKPFVLGQDTVLIKPTDSDSMFLFYCLQSTDTQRTIFKLAGGSTFSRINLGDIRKLKALYPPLPEQNKIAKTLSTWDKAISTTERLIDNSKQQKKALMQQLLTGNKRLLDDNGKVFWGEWEEVKLGEICKVNPKKISKPQNGLVSFIPMDAVSGDAKLLRVETKQYSEVSKGFTSFIDGDILVAKITPCFENGKGAQVDNLENGVGFGSTEFHVLRAEKKSCPRFIYFLTNTFGFRVRGEMNMQGSAGQKRVTTDYLKHYKVNAPTALDEQQKIAALLTNADKETNLLEQQLADLKEEKKALMQQLLTGKRRVQI